MHKFSSLFWQRELVWQSRGSYAGDHFLHSHDFNVWFMVDVNFKDKLDTSHS